MLQNIFFYLKINVGKGKIKEGKNFKCFLQLSIMTHAVIPYLLQLLETTHQKLRQVEVKYQAELKTTQERITQEEETVISLKNEVAEREIQITKMKKSMKEVSFSREKN